MKASNLPHRARDQVSQTADAVTDIPAIAADPIKFCENLPIGYKYKFSFKGREWLKQILTDEAKIIVMLKGRQIGWSVLLSALMAYNALRYPGCEILYCTASWEQFRYFSQGRLRPMLKGQQVQLAKDENRIKSLRLTNGSLITLISGSDEFAQSLGHSVDVLMLDEAEKLPIHAIGRIKETLHASKIKKMYVGGTGGLEGSDWEKFWLNTTQSDWYNGKWNKSNESNRSGYHLPQKLSPHWTQKEDDDNRHTYSKIEYDTEILGIFSHAAEIPLPESMVRECQNGSVWDSPPDQCIAGIDLAAGGDADTVIVITNPECTKIHYAERIDKSYTTDIMPYLSRVIKQYNPYHIAIDAGGNKELRHALEQEYSVMPYRMAAPNDPIKYGDTEHVINRTFFVQSVITKFHDKLITLPIPEPWVVEQLSAERAVTRKSADRGSYLAYEKQDGRKDDLLMALVFAQASAYGNSDSNNPHNKVGASGIG